MANKALTAEQVRKALDGIPDKAIVYTSALNGGDFQASSVTVTPSKQLANVDAANVEFYKHPGAIVKSNITAVRIA